MNDEELREIRELPHKLMQLAGDAAIDTIDWIFFVATVIAAVFGVISWGVLPRFRTFRNYVLLSAIIANALLRLVLDLSDRLISEEAVENNPAVRVLSLALFLYFLPVFQYWLLVLCYVFSVDFVKVYQYDVHRKYLWSNLFAWGVPFITVLIYVVVGTILLNMPEDDAKDIFVSPFTMLLIIIPSVISFITYIAVVIGLFTGISKNNLCGRFTIATLIFVITNVFLITAVTEILEKDILGVNIMGELLEYALTIALLVFIVVLKSNWKLWRDHFNKISAPESGVMLGDQRI